jgi:hypothetical protein
MNEGDFNLFAEAWCGSVQIGIAGAGATATIGAMGEGACGHVTVAGPPGDRRFHEQLLELARETRGRLDPGRSASGRHRRGVERDPVGGGD